MKKSKILTYLGTVLIVSAFVFVFVAHSVVVYDPETQTSRDIFGFVIPEPANWTAYIPYLNFVAEFFSFHGLFVIIVTLLIMGLGGWLLSLGNDD